MAFWRSYAHLVWATKNREPFIQAKIAKDLYAYMVNKAAELDCYVHAINGLQDHVHLVISIPPKHSVAWVVKTLKGASSHFVNHTLRPPEFHFAWQRGYGYLSLGEGQRVKAVAYVVEQKERHAQNNTNPWLEKYSELDEGPEQPGIAPVHEPSRLMMCEDQIGYGVLGEPPF